jgi:diaminopimelate epimerase
VEDLEFWKMSGSGNDFIIVDNRADIVPEERMGPFVRSVCRRRISVGADGVIFLTGSERFDFAWRFFNADGGEVEMCGNGSRCIARFAFLKGIAGPDMTFETLAGPIQAHVDGRSVKVLMPRPAGLRKGLDLDLGRQGGGVVVRADFINTGVPHAVVRVDRLAEYPVFEQGRALRYHAAFAPAGTNVNFMKVMGPHDIEIRTYERGVEGETLACGTGAIACALVGAAAGEAVSPVRIKTRGGETLTIHFEQEGEAFERVFLEGSTSLVYRGFLGQEALD